MRALKTRCPALAIVALAAFVSPDLSCGQDVRSGSAIRAAGVAQTNQLGYGAGRLGLSARRKASVGNAQDPDLNAAPPLHPYTPYYYYYGYAPWWSAPRSIKYKRSYYPHPGENEPRLGLHAYDPYSWEMGLQLPVDSDPLPTYVPGQLFEGMVARALRAKVETDPLKGNDAAITLMRAGKYRAAGRLLAEGFRRDDSPRYPLLLAEVFFGLGKFAHAQLLLEEALRDPTVGSYLPRNATLHFPSAEAFQKQLIALEENKGTPLVRAYFLLHSTTPDAGLEILRQVVENDGNPLAEAAGILYRHYLGQVFAPLQKTDDEEDSEDNDNEDNDSEDRE